MCLPFRFPNSVVVGVVCEGVQEGGKNVAPVWVCGRGGFEQSETAVKASAHAHTHLQQSAVSAISIRKKTLLNFKICLNHRTMEYFLLVNTGKMPEGNVRLHSSTLAHTYIYTSSCAGTKFSYMLSIARSHALTSFLFRACRL